jgi:hypothetical protein
VSDIQADTDAAAFARRMLDAADDLADLEQTNAEAGALVLAAADIPRRSGHLAAGVRYAATPGGVTLAAAAPYWTFVHWGAPRRGIVARPFLLNALELKQSDVADLYLDHAQSVVTKL